MATPGTQLSSASFQTYRSDYPKPRCQRRNIYPWRRKLPSFLIFNDSCTLNHQTLCESQHNLYHRQHHHHHCQEHQKQQSQSDTTVNHQLNNQITAFVDQLCCKACQSKTKTRTNKLILAWPGLSWLYTLAFIFLCLVPSAVHAQDQVRLGPFREEQGPSTYVGNIASETNLSQNLSSADFRSLRFKIFDDEASKLFFMDEKTGALYTRKKIDREQLCGDRQECILKFDVTVSTDGTIRRIVGVEIVITDKNDNPPKFEKAEIIVDIPENNEVGFTKRLDPAFDPDIGDFTVKEYFMVQPVEPFTINAYRRLDNRFTLKLVVNAALDREKKDYYTVKIAAKDGGLQPLTGTLTVNINVTDKNDNSPKFTQQSYSFTVEETAATGQVLSKLTATDKDFGKNADVRYSMTFSTADQRGNDLFAIDEYTGEITITAPLQFDAGKTFRAVVEAQDQGDQPRLAEAELLLAIINVGNNPPRLDLKLQKTDRDVDVVGIPEDAKNFFVGKLTAIDNDPGASGEVSCRSRNKDFKLDTFGDSYAIVMNGSLDREVQDSIDVIIECIDAGSPPKSQTVEFPVDVLDVNDNPPRFSQSLYTVDIEEENIVGKQIFKMSAVDPDSTNNNVFKYSLFPRENTVFSIDENTGVIKARMTFDHEVQKRLNVIVKATDSNNPALVSTATVIVNIVDINDNTPELVTKVLRVPEGGGRMKPIGRLRGSDKDSGQNAQLVFFMPPEYNSDTSHLFKVDRDGTVQAIQELDRETKDSYELTIEVRDQGKPSRESRNKVLIVVEDINDNQPVFLYPKTQDETVTFLWSTRPLEELVRLNATDADIGENKTITYVIYHGNNAGIFEVNPETGVISLRRYIREEDARIFKLMVAAKDNGKQAQEVITHIGFIVDATNASFEQNALNWEEFHRGAKDELRRKREEQYILIAGIVAGVTLLFSIIIIVVIILIRRGGSDSRRRRQQVQVPMSDKQPQWEVVKMSVQEEGGKEVEKVVAWRGSDVDINVKSGGGDGNICGSDRGSYGQPDVTKTGHDSTLKKTVASSHWYDEKDDHVNTPSSSSNIGIGLDPYRKQDFYTFCKVRAPPHGDDVNSVTSGETATSDSGRGGSEDDIPLPPIAECSPELNSNHSSPKHVVEYRPITTSPPNSLARSPYGGKSEFRTMPTLSSFRGGSAADSIKMYPVSSTTTRPLHSGDSTPVGSVSHSPYRTLPSYMDKANPKPSSQDYTSLAPISHGSSGSLSGKPIGSQGRHVTFSPSQPSMRGVAQHPIFTDPQRRSPFMPIVPSSAGVESLYSSNGRPRSIDDDDGNTTTSGSYTIDSDNLNDLNDSMISA